MHAKGDRCVRASALLASVLATACAHTAPGTQAEAGGSGKADATSAELSRLSELASQRERRISQLESRLALLEAEQRELRYALSESRGPLRETVRIGAHVRRGGERSKASTGGAPPGKRPMLRLTGTPKRAGSASKRSGPLPPVPQVSERLAVAPLPEVGASAPPAASQERYRAALRMLHDRRFREAAAAFNEFLVRFPGDGRAPLAMYWRGEALFATQQYARAIEAFQGAMARAPQGKRAADALWKIAICHKRLGSAKRARAALERLKTQFPHSDAAKQASREDA